MSTWEATNMSADLPQKKAPKSADMRTDAQKKDDRWNRIIFSPLTLILGMVFWNAWPILAGIALIWLFVVWTKHWAKGGRFAENASVMTVPRVYCMQDDIVHTGHCPKCGSTDGIPVNHLGHKPKPIDAEPVIGYYVRAKDGNEIFDTEWCADCQDGCPSDVTDDPNVSFVPFTEAQNPGFTCPRCVGTMAA